MRFGMGAGLNDDKENLNSSFLDATPVDSKFRR